MDTDSIRIWIYVALGLGIAELVFNRLVFISAAIACLTTPVALTALPILGLPTHPALPFAGGTFILVFGVLSFCLWRIRGRTNSPWGTPVPIGERFTLGPTVSGGDGQEFVLRVGKRLFIVNCPDEPLKEGWTVEITGFDGECVLVQPVPEALPPAEMEFSSGSVFRPYRKQPEEGETIEEESEPPVEHQPVTKDELSPLLDSISDAINGESDAETSDDAVTINDPDPPSDDEPPHPQ